MYKVKILGAGSIGNHLSNASRALGWSVDMCDIDEAALERTKNEIYPMRYGAWDDEIRLMKSEDAPKGGYDLIFIGTPPDSHIPLALEALKEKPKAVLIEKPLCTPGLEGAQELFELSASLGIPVFTGYDHVVGLASDKVGELLDDGRCGRFQTLDVEFREYWGGIFAAHPWLDGPGDTYLGFWKKGGGASGEHSHAINLWQHYAHTMDAGRVVEVSAMLEYVEENGTSYDSLCIMNLKTETGFIGRVVQDVVTQPPRKWARIQGDNGYIDWQCGYKPGCDMVTTQKDNSSAEEFLIEKSRPDDFIKELRHIEAALNSNPSKSPISLERGLDTMMVVAAAHLSAQENRTIKIDYSKGYTQEALTIV